MEDAVAKSKVFTPEDLDPGPDEDELDDVRRLGRALAKERGTPALLDWDADLVGTLLDKLEQQGKMMSTLRADPSTSEEEHFRLVLVQTEMERAKWLVRSYVRARLHKIERYAQHIATTPELHARLSGGELAHARRYADLIARHYSSSVLDSLPEWLRRMDESSGGVSMVTKPNHAQPVLIYIRKDCGELVLDGDEVAELTKGSSHLVRYDLVERWVQLGWAEVL
ncbi:GINS complex, Sld5 component [Cutaneotrichosporon oleaginosum]|uniref:DNA replication complex GINS protein SLD5 n=1 Tax=Cutaneotrichosporon oleaginosum TaxID=879819 RepID=A0A0J1B0N3_9TREE|nr:GINS complex, Sld5 component [Cutaneotrichosporon oleaginosum]KLT41169.1 GINS complex, Sld5 component [Cutaneotrichosporon oleaginosum]TXT14113.1 hypothetical protein COLE_00306 [Cutaneotrichosporon oleaginosum]